MNASQTVTATSPVTQDAGVVARTHGSGDRYVVGIDGSEQSIDALRWAARTATGTHARIEIITTWEPRVGMAGPYTAQTNGTYTTPKDDAQALLSRVANGVYGTDHPPNVILRTREGHAADILIEESKTAQLLVIGSRGLGEVAGLLLGSVSAHCAEKAHCPVLIMHAPDPS